MMVFGSALVNDNTEDRAALAKMIADSVNTDLSQPEFPDHRDAWNSDLALRTLEGAAGQKGLRWAALEDVYRQGTRAHREPIGLRACLALAGIRRAL